jgi:integrase
VKNGVVIEILLSGALARRVERHFHVFRPLLTRRRQSTAFFPGKIDAHLTTQMLGKSISRLVGEQLGARFSPHVARHLAAYSMLQADPNNIYIVQRLLGHTSTHTTLRIYGGPRTSGAQRAWSRHLDENIQVNAETRPHNNERQKRKVG